MNQRQKRKINIVDVFIIIALLAAVLVAGIGLIQGLGSGVDRVTVRYIVEVDPIDSDFTSKVAAGNGIYDYSSAGRIGTVSAVSAAQAYYEDSDTPMEGSSVLYITAETEAVKTDTGYTVGDVVIGIGRELEMRLPGLYCVGKCVSIEITE